MNDINNIINNSIFVKHPDESIEQYCHRISLLKDDFNLTWENISNIINNATELNLTANAVRKREQYYINRCINNSIKILTDSNNEEENNVDISLDELAELKKERKKIADERSQLNAIYKRIAREDSIKEIAHDIIISNSNLIKLDPQKVIHEDADLQKKAILLISDWHYGIEIDNVYNYYDTTIAKNRITKLMLRVIEKLKKEHIYDLYVLNLGDMIAGRIHLPLRINSRIDVITQIIEVSELIAQFLSGIANEGVTVHYYSTMDNHSRIEPNIKDSIELESLVRITDWYLKERLKNFKSIKFYSNIFGDDIITFKCLGHDVCAVHGHKDKPDKIIDQLSMYVQQHFDLICAAHFHHFNCEEKNETVFVSNSSLMGTDEFAQNLRLNSKPSQTLIVVTPQNVCDTIYKINLD